MQYGHHGADTDRGSGRQYRRRHAQRVQQGSRLRQPAVEGKKEKRQNRYAQAGNSARAQ